LCVIEFHNERTLSQKGNLPTQRKPVAKRRSTHMTITAGQERYIKDLKQLFLLTCKVVYAEFLNVHAGLVGRHVQTAVGQQEESVIWVLVGFQSGEFKAKKNKRPA
jgi:hypothetical protein